MGTLFAVLFLAWVLWTAYKMGEKAYKNRKTNKKK